jgi:hypothetical protein
MPRISDGPVKAQSRSAIKDDDLAPSKAAAELGMRRQTVGRCLRSTRLNAHTYNSEVRRLREENRTPKVPPGKPDLEKLREA